MKKIKVMSIFGTRPEATKMCPVIDVLSKNDSIESIICVTAQHRQMLDQVLDVFKMKPDFDLNIMQERQTLAQITVSALLGIQEVLEKVKPDLILVHGDTTTTFASALAAFYKKIPVGHVEAGLRTFDRFQPYPEEINRVLTDSIAELYFAPTADSKSNLLKENKNPESIFITGNTAIDSVKYSVTDNFVFSDPKIAKADFSKRVITLTAHRSENLGEPMENICKAVKKLVTDNEGILVIWPVHYNPAVREIAYKYLTGDEAVFNRIILTDPPDMAQMHNLMRRSYLVLTDSGGLQEEATALNKPVVVLRNVTERPEGLAAGTLVLAGTNQDDIYSITTRMLNDSEYYNKMVQAKNPFGDGNASERILQAILFHFGCINERPADYL